MKTYRVSEDNWKGVTSDDREYYCNNFDEIAESLKNLDGRSKTMVVIYADDDDFLTVGGGNENRYVCYHTGSEKMMNLVSADDLISASVEIVAGGQRGVFPSTLCVNLDDVVQAAEYYFGNQAMDPALDWVEQY